MAPYQGFLGPSYLSSSYLADTERCINFYLEKNETPNAPTPYCLLPTPGYTVISTVPEGPIKGTSAIADGREFYVAGFRLYENVADVPVARGTLASNANPATLCWNGPAGDQLFITSGDVGYILNLTSNVLTTVLVSGATMGSFLDGYFLALDAATGTLQISDLLDGLTWDPTQIAQRTAGADPWIAMTVIHREIWLIGSRTGEVWYDAGTFPFPFAPIPGAFFEQGIVAPFSATRDVAPLLWVSQNAQGARLVLQAQGYDGTRISTHGVESQLRGYATVADAESMSVQIGGHLFYIVTFKAAGHTWVYDVTEGAWGEWLYWDHATSTYEALRVMCHMFSNGRHIVGDTATGRLYEMSLTVFTDVDEAPIRRMRQPPRISFGQKRFTVNTIQLILDVGIGLSTGQGSDPQCMRRASRDGGKTFGPEKWRSMGKQGAYSTRVIWRACGMARNYVDEFVWSDPVPVRVTDAEMDVTVGAS
jgi:hypothetical protein